jgi:metal-responsive CopG/Arc/MetJ family transcriptional regulator
MKTAISIPDPVFEEAEDLARRLEKSRSQLYAEAVAEYVARHDPDTVTARLDAVVDAVGDEDDPFVRESARRILSRVEW